MVNIRALLDTVVGLAIQSGGNVAAADIATAVKAKLDPTETEEVATLLSDVVTALRAS